MGKQYCGPHNARLFKPLSALAVTLCVAVIALDFALLFVFYLQVRDEYDLFQTAKECPSNNATICCSSVPLCPTHTNTSTCVDDRSFSGNCCVRSDEVGYFAVVAGLFFFIFVVQVLDLISKVVLCRRPSEHLYVKLWETVLALMSLGTAIGLVIISSVTSEAGTPFCYDDVRVQNALRRTVDGYVGLFQLSVAEVTLVAILTAIDFTLVFGIVRADVERERQKRLSRMEMKKSKKELKKSQKELKKSQKEQRKSTASVHPIQVNETGPSELDGEDRGDGSSDIALSNVDTVATDLPADEDFETVHGFNNSSN